VRGVRTVGHARVVTTPSDTYSVSSYSTSAWSPLRIVAFRALWLAQLASMIGTWMQTVGAQWLLIDEPDAPTLVSLVQTASLLPMLLLALPAGVLADSLDRRRLLVGIQVSTLAVGGVLSVATAVGDITPQVLLGLTFLIGCGQAMSMPPWQALIPDVVPTEQVRAASALGAVSVNLARAVGPGIAGFLITQVDVWLVFALNAAAYGLLALVVLRWGPAGRVSGDVPERFGPALRAGARYVRHSRVVRRLLFRSALFVLPGSALWALLPLVASLLLGLGSGGYGILLGALGVGAVAGALALPRVLTRVSTAVMMLIASVVFAAAEAGIVLVRNVPLAVGLLLLAGAAWLAVLSTLSAATQVFLPEWVRARGLSVQQIVMMGGQAVGALVWGVAANRFGLVAAFVAAAVLMVLGAVTSLVWPLFDTTGLDRTTVHWPEPQVMVEPDRDEGPVLITVTFTVPPGNERSFVEAMQRVQASRRRTGATRWNLYRDAAEPSRFMETFLVPSWEEHLRQHRERPTATDRDIVRAANSLAVGTPQVSHLLRAR
jgi:MFS family permease